MPAPRRSIRDELTELRVRLEDAEARATWLARRLAKAEKALKLPATPKKKGKPKLRCPGCFLELPPGRVGKNCRYCGFDFRAVKPYRR